MSASSSPAAELPLRVRAPAKINLGLFVGPLRASDSRHELVSVAQAISLADELTLERAGVDGGADEVICPGLELAAGENLAATALRAFRAATGWDPGALRLSIAKQIPAAAGLGGGSSDAAGALRLAAAASGLGSEPLLHELARELGADVPALLTPGRWLMAGAGERLAELPQPSHPFGVLVLPAEVALSTADVYAQAERLGIRRSHADLEALEGELRRALELGAGAPADARLLQNDLQEAARSLCSAIDEGLAEARDAGAEAAFVSGSGPTVVGLFLRANGAGRAQRAADGLSGREPRPIAAVAVDAEFARVSAATPDIRVRHNPLR